MKISRLIKSFQEKKRGNSFLAKLKKILTEKDNIIQLIPIFLFIFLCCHCVACFWHYFAWHDTDRETWISRTSFRDEDVFDRYIASLYFVFQTVRPPKIPKIIKNFNFLTSLFRITSTLPALILTFSIPLPSN